MGYIDIDSFKAFNTKYGETSVDRYLLPRFMRTLEAHTLFHGHTYRFGGDEYMVLLPNMSFDHGMNFLSDLPRKLSVLDYGEITEKTTVSIGVCIVEVDTFLTDREVEQKANEAKNYAKKNGGNCIASYKGIEFRAEDLHIMRRNAVAPAQQALDVKK